MNTDKKTRIEDWNAITERVIGCAFRVGNTLGVGFLEKVYERALIAELRLRGLSAESQVPLKVVYKGEAVGDYFADVLVEGQLIIELKCCDCLGDEIIAQCINYLTITGKPLLLLVNFQNPRLEWRRIVAKRKSTSRTPASNGAE